MPGPIHKKNAWETYNGWKYDIDFAFLNVSDELKQYVDMSQSEGENRHKEARVVRGSGSVVLCCLIATLFDW